MPERKSSGALNRDRSAELPFGAMNRSSRRKEAPISFRPKSLSLLTSAATKERLVGLRCRAASRQVVRHQSKMTFGRRSTSGVSPKPQEVGRVAPRAPRRANPLGFRMISPATRRARRDAPFLLPNVSLASGIRFR